MEHAALYVDVNCYECGRCVALSNALHWDGRTYCCETCVPPEAKGGEMGKSPEMERTLETISQKLFGRSRQDSACVACGSEEIKPENFRDDLSRKEFTISHLCQGCQDEVFKPINERG